MPACLRALRDQDVGSRRRRFLRLLQRLHLADQLRARFPDPGGEGARVAEGQHHRRGPMSEGEVEQFRPFGQAPCDESATHPRIAGRFELLLQPLAAAVSASDEPEAAGLADRGGQPAGRHQVHRREQDGVLDAEHLGHTSLERHCRWLSLERDLKLSCRFARNNPLAPGRRALPTRGRAAGRRRRARLMIPGTFVPRRTLPD